MSSRVSVAIFGLSPVLGQPVLNALQSAAFAGKIKFPIKVVSRQDKPSTSQIQFIRSDLPVKELAAQLKGTTAFVELLPPVKPLFDSLEELAAIVKPEIFIPSRFGVDVSKVWEYAPGFMYDEVKHSENLRALGIKTVDIATSYFAAKGLWLYELVGHAGIDPATKSYVVRGDINQKFNVSTPEDIGKTVAALVTKEDYSSIPDKVKIFSDEITIKQVIEKYEQDHNLKLTQTKIQSADEVLKEFKADWAKGFSFDKFFYYLNVVISQGAGKGALFEENDRELVNPGESVWKWGKY